MLYFASNSFISLACKSAFRSSRSLQRQLELIAAYLPTICRQVERIMIWTQAGRVLFSKSCAVMDRRSPECGFASRRAPHDGGRMAPFPHISPVSSELTATRLHLKIRSVITKTISLDLDAYQSLRLAKRPGEKFSAVVRPICLDRSPDPTGAELLEWFSADGTGASGEYLDSLEEALQQDSRVNSQRH